ncbi:inactive serine protease 54 [Carettochelys insculpta]|uniref:inactive serine protease 54 n=1 Tax=Carettochelys insculpta TaxID=44489 RepID=UPI003EBE93BD
MEKKQQGCGTQSTLAPPRSTQEFVAVGEFPWVVSIQDLQHNHLAFGSILSEHWILSAAATFQMRGQDTCAQSCCQPFPCTCHPDAANMSQVQSPILIAPRLCTHINCLTQGDVTMRPQVCHLVPTELSGSCHHQFLGLCAPSAPLSLSRQPAFAVVGLTDLSMQKPQLQYSISNVTPHEDFNEITLDRNLALLRTATPVPFTEAVQPICFPGRNLTAAALENCWVAGWLHPTTVVGTGSRAAVGFLRKLSVVDADPCPLKRIVTTECSSHRDSDNVTGCLGDQGNPVMCQAKGTRIWVLNGVLSQGGMRCYGPFLYTKVAYYSGWISATTAEAELPIYPMFPRGHSALQAPAGDLESSAEPAEVFHFSVISEGRADHGQTNQQAKDIKPAEGGLARSYAKSDPVYYDYYSGETLPISQGSLSQPQPLAEMSAVFLLISCLFY